MASKDRFNQIDCLEAALPDEEYFVLLARDPAMPALIAIWASLRVGNAAAAMDNFTRLVTPELIRHYTRHPDHAKSAEAINVAQRAMEWREANVGGPNAVPTWKRSLVRPKMLQIQPMSDADQGLMQKIACGLRQVAEDMGAFVGDKEGGRVEEFNTFRDRINGYAAELEAAVANPPMLLITDTISDGGEDASEEPNEGDVIEPNDDRNDIGCC